MSSLQQRSPIRGRDAELAGLGEQLAHLRSGRGAIVLVGGGPGMGKTRLLDEAVAAARRLGVRVGRHASSTGKDIVPLGGLMDALLGGPAPLFAATDLSALDASPEHRYGLLHELEALLAGAAADGPLAVVLDDLQWADVATVAAVETLSGRLADAPIAWIVAVRHDEAPPEVDRVLKRIAAAHGAWSVTLGALPPAAIADVARDVLGAEPDPALLALAEGTNGAPFWLSELLRGLCEQGLVEATEGVARLRARQVPARVAVAMRERLALVSATARDVVSVAAVLGHRTSFEHLGLMLKVEAFDLIAPVRELLTADVLAEHDDLLGFANLLVRDAVLATLPAVARVALERQAARVLMQTGTPPVEIAERLVASAQPGDEEAIELLLLAARSLATWNAGRAAEMLSHAVDLMATDDARRAGVVAEAVTCLHAAGQVEQAAALAGGALRDLLPAEAESELQYTIAGMTSLSADLRIAAGRRALELPELTPTVRARHLARLVHNLVAAGRRNEAHALLDTATEAVRHHGDDAATYSLRFAFGGLTYQDGDFGLALCRLEDALRDSANSSEQARASLGQHWRCEVLIVLDRFDDAIAVGNDALVTARREGQDWVARSWERFLGRQHQRRGDHALAVSTLERELPDDPRRAELSMIAGATVDALAGAALHLGDRVLEQRCAAVARTMVELGPPAVQRQGAWILARQAMAAGDAQAGRRLLLDLAVPDGESILPPSPAEVTDAPQLVRLALAAGDRELGQRALAFATKLARRNPSVPSVVGAAAHARGLLEGDLQALRDAVAHFERSPRRPALASALEDAAVAAATAGDEQAAIRDLGRALDLLVAMGAVTDTARVRRRLRALGVVRRVQAVERPSTGWEALTEAELSVVRAISAGMTNRGAAEHLFLSPHTINAHLRNVFAKLDINSRVELARLATLHGATTDEPVALAATG